MEKGKLYLIPSLLGETEINRVIPEHNISIVHTLDSFVVEELRTARRFLKKCKYPRELDTISFYVLNEHSETTSQNAELGQFLNKVEQGISIGLLSEAGCPGIADPGADLVRMAHERNIRVIPLTGPSSIFLALMASGMSGQQFTFHGYLPAKTEERKLKIREIDRLCLKHNHSHIFIEAPYRNTQLIQALLSNCSDQTLLCIAQNISTESESIITRSIKGWKTKPPEPGKVPVVYILY